MKAWMIALVFAAGVLVGCMAAGPPLAAQSPPASGAPAPAAPVERPASAGVGTPLLIDRTDLRIGTTVQFSRIPTASELHDAAQTPGLTHIVVSLPSWPPEFAALQVLEQTPPEADVVVVLPGWPPSRAAAQAWNYLNARLRIIAVVAGPPPSGAVISDLNSMHGLERVIAQMDLPARTGFEQLQRPLSFRRVID